jgi:hypothetical protein
MEELPVCSCSPRAAMPLWMDSWPSLVVSFVAATASCPSGRPSSSIAVLPPPACRRLVLLPQHPHRPPTLLLQCCDRRVAAVAVVDALLFLAQTNCGQCIKVIMNLSAHRCCCLSLSLCPASPRSPSPATNRLPFFSAGIFRVDVVVVDSGYSGRRCRLL